MTKRDCNGSGVERDLHSARRLRAQGRALEALELLSAARAEAVRIDDPMLGALLAELVDLRETMSDLPTLRGLIDQITPDHPEAQLRAAQALLALGDFEEAMRRLFALIRRGMRRHPALHMLLVCAALCDRHRAAASALRRLRGADGPVDRDLLIDTWRRAIMGRARNRQWDARAAGADPNRSLLQPLLARSLVTLEAALGWPARRSPEEEHALMRHRAACLAAMGRADAAAAALPETTREPLTQPADPGHAATLLPAGRVLGSDTVQHVRRKAA